MTKKRIAAGERAALMLAGGTRVCYRPECRRSLVVKRGNNRVADFEIVHIRDELPPLNPDADIGWRYWPDRKVAAGGGSEGGRATCCALMRCLWVRASRSSHPLLGSGCDR